MIKLQTERLRAPNFSFDRDHFVWALGSACQIKRLPFDPHLLLQQCPPPYDLAALLKSMAALGLKPGLRSVKGGEICHMALPCLVLLKPGGDQPGSCARETPAENSSEANSPFCPLALIVKADAERVLLFEPANPAPSTFSVAEFDERFAQWAIMFAPQGEAVVDEDDPGKAQEFGFKWFTPELLRHRHVWRDVLLASLAIQLMALATPLFTQAIIDKVVVHHTRSTLVVIAIALAVFMVFTAIMTWVRQYLVLHTGNRVDAVLATAVFDHLFRLPPRYFESRPTGTIAARIQGVETVREFISGAVVTLFLDFPFMLIFLGIMFYYSVGLTLLTLGLLGLIVGMSVLISPILRGRLNQQFLLGARNQAFLTEYVAGIETVKSLQMEPQLKARFGDYLADYLRADFGTRQLSNTYNTAANTIEQLLSLSVLCVGAYLVMTSANFTIGMLVAFQMFSGRLSQPLLRLVGLWQQFQQVSISVKRLGDLMNAPVEPYAIVPSRESGGPGLVEIANLSFRYGENLPYLYRNLNLVLGPGFCVVLTGPSGSGKSTLTKLLQGFYRPSDGQIKIDGRDVLHLSANELRSHFGVVPQETVLFSGTIYDNLIMANPHASFEEVVRACKLAEIHEVIDKLPDGYHTKIGERGTGLSGGQRQRLAIARALLKRPKILIFDEATANLDQATAEHFAKTINTFKGKVTMLFITHQLPRGLKVDEIVHIGAKPGEPGQRDCENLAETAG